MSATAVRRLDRLDRAILARLEDNARASNADIARHVGMSAPGVAERIARLNDAGVIVGLRAHIDPACLGYEIGAFVEFTPHGPNGDQAVAHVEKLPEVSDCYRVTGTAFLLMFVRVRDNGHLNDLLLGLAKIGSTKTSVVLRTEFENRPLLAGATP